MFANSAFGRVSLILFSLACAREDLQQQSIPRFFFVALFIAELLFYLQLFVGGARALSSEIPASLLLSLPLLGFSLLTRRRLFPARLRPGGRFPAASVRADTRLPSRSALFSLSALPSLRKA